MTKLTLHDLDVSNKKVLMRVDYNVPLKEDKTIADDFRIKASLPSIRYILDHGGSVILMSHLGKPNPLEKKGFSLSICAKRLSELLSVPVHMAPDCVGFEVEKMAKSLKPKEVLLLENLRYYEAEEKPEKDPSFAKKLSLLGDVYVNDAFGTAHRKHSSTYTIAQYFPGKAAMGFLMEKEVQFLGSALKNPEKPFYAILGGSKVSSKIKIILKLLEKVDALFIGGGMAYTFLKSQNISVGKSLVEDDQINIAKEIMIKCKEKKIAIHLPIDTVASLSLEDPSSPKLFVFSQEKMPDDYLGVDIGPNTIKEWKKLILKGKTIFWNGPLGVFEIDEFSKGTKAIAEALAETKAITIVGGGDSAAAIHALHLENAFTHISTGGGASLEYIEQGSLPGIEALSDKKK
jgi:phosphoglycerate kinase